MGRAAEELLPGVSLISEGTSGIVYCPSSSSPNLADRFSVSVDLPVTPPSNMKKVVGIRSARRISFKSNCSEANVDL